MPKNLFVYSMTLVIVGLILVNKVVAQEPPPPPPLIFSPPTPDEIKEYVFEGCGYAISLAGELQINHGPDGCRYVGAKRKGSSATFRMMLFTDSDLKEHPPDEIFRRVKEAYLSPGEFKVIAEKEVKIFGEKGFDYSLSNGIQYRRLRVFIKNNIAYEFFIDVTNWHILSNFHPEIAKAFEIETDRFFGSLRFLKQ